jgi:hypothetical protein
MEDILPIDLKGNPLLRELLINHCIYVYGEDADLTIKGLLLEYYDLAVSDELNELISAAAYNVFSGAGLI